MSNHDHSVDELRTEPAAQPPQLPPPPPPLSESGGVIRKSPGAAAALSLFPGLGHLYLGLYERGFMLAVAVITAFYVEIPLIGVFLFFFTMIDAYRQGQIINLGGYDPTPKPTRRPGGGLGLGVFLVVIGAVLLLRQWVDIDDYLEYLRDWWPVLLIGAGGYFIWGWYREREQKRRSEAFASHELDEP